MSIDLFGRVQSNSGDIPTVINQTKFFLFNKEGDFDIQNKKLRNVSDAVDEKDVVNLKVLKNHLIDLNTNITSLKNNLNEIKDDEVEILDRLEEERTNFETFIERIIFPLINEVIEIKKRKKGESMDKINQILTNVFDFVK